MSVVLRCPSCGTTRPAPGECEACHEAVVRFYCTNHTPGLWLAEPSCPSCGARFGEPARVAGTAPRPTVPPAAARVEKSRIPGRESVPVARRAARSVTSGSPPHSRADTPPDMEESGLRRAPWQDVLSAALSARRAVIAAREPHRRLVNPAGCLGRALLVMVLMVVLLGSAIFFFGRALLNSFVPY